VTDLTGRLARLRVWAERRTPNGHYTGPHNYDGACPWCRSDSIQPERIAGFTFDGNAHDLALELLDEIDRLRAIIDDVRAEGEPAGEYGCAWCGADQGHKTDCAWLKIAAEV
jgi:hypothetical protein